MSSVSGDMMTDVVNAFRDRLSAEEITGLQQISRTGGQQPEVRLRLVSRRAAVSVMLWDNPDQVLIRCGTEQTLAIVKAWRIGSRDDVRKRRVFTRTMFTAAIDYICEHLQMGLTAAMVPATPASTRHQLRAPIAGDPAYSDLTTVEEVAHMVARDLPGIRITRAFDPADGAIGFWFKRAGRQAVILETGIIGDEGFSLATAAPPGLTSPTPADPYEVVYTGEIEWSYHLPVSVRVAVTQIANYLDYPLAAGMQVRPAREPLTPLMQSLLGSGSSAAPTQTPLSELVKNMVINQTPTGEVAWRTVNSPSNHLTGIGLQRGVRKAILLDIGQQTIAGVQQRCVAVFLDPRIDLDNIDRWLDINTDPDDRGVHGEQHDLQAEAVSIAYYLMHPLATANTRPQSDLPVRRTRFITRD